MDKQAVSESIRIGDSFNIKIEIMDSEEQDFIHYIVDQLVNHYRRLEMEELIYSALKELIINGVKANIKHYLFKQSKIDENADGSQESSELLKSALREEDLMQHRKLVHDNNLKVDVNIVHSKERIAFKIINNTPMTHHEYKRITEKFNRALEYETIVEYYMEYADDTEGSGLGITMIVIMLKGVGIDPHSLKIDNSSMDSTVAELDLPLV